MKVILNINNHNVQDKVYREYPLQLLHQLMTYLHDLHLSSRHQDLR